MTENDKKIIELKEKVQAKKESLKDYKNTKLETSGTLVLNGEKYNLLTMDKEDLTLVLIELLVRKETMNKYEKFNLLNDCNICGYNIQVWISDIENRISIVSTQDEIEKLNKKVKQLDNVLSEEAKTALLLKEIEEDLE